MNRKKAMSSNCLNRQKASRVRVCDQEDRMLFFMSKKASPDRSDLFLFIAESHESVNRASAVLPECFGGSLTEVDGKGLVFLNR